MIAEFFAAVVVWAATLAFSQLGVDIDLSRAAKAERVVERTMPAVTAPAAHEDCPDEARARLVDA